MNPQIILNFNMANQAERLSEGQTLDFAVGQSLPTPSVMATSAVEAASSVSPTPLDYVTTLSASSAASLPTPLGLEAAQSEKGIAEVPTPLGATASSSGGVAEQTAPTPFTAIETAFANVLGVGNIPSPFDARQASSISVASFALPEPNLPDLLGSVKSNATPEPQTTVADSNIQESKKGDARKIK